MVTTMRCNRPIEKRGTYLFNYQHPSRRSFFDQSYIHYNLKLICGKYYFDTLDKN